MKKSKLLKETFLSIIDASTVHGLPNIFRTTLVILKLIWFLCTTASVLACAFFIMQSVNDFLNFDYVTNIDNIYEQNLQFPTVSFCSTSKNFEKVPLKDILKECYYRNYMDCFINSENYFEPYNDTSYGKCYRFHGGGNQMNFTASLPGKTSGLILNLTEANGLTIFVHNTSRKPFDIEFLNDLNGNGIYASSGFVTDLIVTKIQSERLPPPYNDCFKNARHFTLNKTLVDEILRTDGSYYQLNCYRLCFDLAYINDNPCNCSASLGNVWKHCAFKDKQISDCTTSYRKNYYNKNFFETCSKYCPLECDSVEYQNTYSMLPQIANYTKIYVYFGELKYTLISQQPKTMLADLVSNVGGILGLFLGMSFLSFIEIVEIIFELSYIMLFARQKNVISNVSN